MKTATKEHPERTLKPGEQHASYSTFAWMQYFGFGSQGYDFKYGYGRARAVRRLPF